MLQRCLGLGLLLLAAGICFGAIWANRSWGRYWGWDPKETWSLITLFAYLALIHGRSAGWLRELGSALGAILAFLSVVMTYYGVNYVLGTGMHSYGFDSGGAGYVGAFVLLDLLAVGTLAAWPRRGERALCAPPLEPATAQSRSGS